MSIINRETFIIFILCWEDTWRLRFHARSPRIMSSPPVSGCLCILHLLNTLNFEWFFGGFESMKSSSNRWKEASISSGRELRKNHFLSKLSEGSSLFLVNREAPFELLRMFSELFKRLEHKREYISDDSGCLLKSLEHPRGNSFQYEY